MVEKPDSSSKCRAPFSRFLSVPRLLSFFQLFVASLVIGANPLVAGTPALDTLESNCLECHYADSSKGDVRLDNLTADFSDAESAHAWMRVLEQLQADLMPPVKKPRIEKQSRKRVDPVDRN